MAETGQPKVEAGMNRRETYRVRSILRRRSTSEDLFAEEVTDRWQVIRLLVVV